jgi:hypothetical protein
MADAGKSFGVRVLLWPAEPFKRPPRFAGGGVKSTGMAAALVFDWRNGSISPEEKQDRQECVKLVPKYAEIQTKRVVSA